MKILINYADDKFRQAQKLCTWTGYKLAKFDKVIEYGPYSVDYDFYNKNKEWFVSNDTKIGRYCLWRPHIIWKTIEKAKMGDYICYCDSGACFIKKIDILIEFMEKHNEDLLCFDIPFLEYQWTKRDVFDYFNLNEDEYLNSNQRCSTYFIFKVTNKTKKMFKEYKVTSEVASHLFTDEISQHSNSNYEGFIENRHNQSVFSLLTKKYKYQSYRDISEFGSKPELYGYTENVIFSVMDHPESNYPQMVILHRCPKFSFINIVKLFARFILPIKLYYKLLFEGQTYKAKLKNK